MKLNKYLMSTVALAILANPFAKAEAQEAEVATDWQPRTIDQVAQELVAISEREISYTIQYGDTLEVISAAMLIPVEQLELVEQLLQAEIVLPGTELQAEYDVNQEVELITVKSTDGTSVTVDVKAQVIVNNQVTNQQANPAPAAQPVNNLSQIQEVTEWATASATDVAQPTASYQATAPAEPAQTYGQTEVAPAVETTVAPASSEVTEAPAEVVLGESANEGHTVEVPATDLGFDAPADETVEVIPETGAIVATPDNNVEGMEEVVADDNPVEEVTTPTESTPEEVTQPEEVYEEPTYEEPTYEEPVTSESGYRYDPSQRMDGLTESADQFRQQSIHDLGLEGMTIGGLRHGDPGDHGTGRALDYMVYDNAALGNEIANYSIANMSDAGISYVIWQQQIYGDWNNQWEWMEDRGSITQNHYDHVHVSFH